MKGGVALSGSYYPAFGAIAEGIGESAKEGSLARISPQKLDEQLSITQKLNIREGDIYRLGGLNGEYLEVIRKHVSR